VYAFTTESYFSHLSFPPRHLKGLPEPSQELEEAEEKREGSGQDGISSVWDVGLSDLVGTPHHTKDLTIPSGHAAAAK